MKPLSLDYIRDKIADSKVIYKRGEAIFHTGNYTPETFDPEAGRFIYTVDGNYGDYTVTVSTEDGIKTECTCPYPYGGCKHIVAVCLDLSSKLEGESRADGSAGDDESSKPDCLTYEDIMREVIESRKKAAKTEEFEIAWGETCRGVHTVVTKEKKRYEVTIHDPAEEAGHCTCPDFTHNRLNTCKHLLHVLSRIAKDAGLLEQGAKETMPFVHVFWDSYLQKPRYYFNGNMTPALRKELEPYFGENGHYTKRDLGELYALVDRIGNKKNVHIDGYLAKRVESMLFLKEMFAVKKNYRYDWSKVKAELYPYQKEGVEFCLFKTRAIIADEMGLGKTLQAITAALMKKDIFGFERILVVCPASLKEQWKREIERFTDAKAVVVSGPRNARKRQYESGAGCFLITNYEAVLRDILEIKRMKPGLVILDEAQRIKNFNTKTHQAILSLPRAQSLVITGTPLENKLEDLYSIVQFSDPELLSPFWIFSATYLRITKWKKRIVGYTNLDALTAQLKNLVIRRKKADVLDSLPEMVANDYYVELSREQKEIHQGYVSSLAPILGKKILTPMDIKRIQQILLCMRMVCDSTFLIDKSKNVSPKLDELRNILVELVKDNGRKAVVFTEWTTMTYLIGKLLSDLEIPFVEFTGKVPVEQRQKLITEFMTNPACKVFLSTDAGGVGLNLQEADCVINFELPWNPAKLNQRIGRVARIGQKSKCINVINLIAKDSIEEKVQAGIALKQELFGAVLDGEAAEVDFSDKKKTEFINRIREMFGEELETPPKPESEQVEILDDTPYFLNPTVMADEAGLDFGVEEEFEDTAADAAVTGSATEPAVSQNTPPAAPDAMNPETMEEVLGNGVKFLSGLSAMITGKPLVIDDGSKAVTIDRETGEVTLKFRLPGFGQKTE
jgi:hypothetical protein